MTFDSHKDVMWLDLAKKNRVSVRKKGAAKSLLNKKKKKTKSGY